MEPAPNSGLGHCSRGQSRHGDRSVPLLPEPRYWTDPPLHGAVPTAQGCWVTPQHSRQSSGSSDRSPQSSSVSHFHQKGMHLSFLQTNWWREELVGRLGMGRGHPKRFHPQRAQPRALILCCPLQVFPSPDPEQILNLTQAPDFEERGRRTFQSWRLSGSPGHPQT